MVCVCVPEGAQRREGDLVRDCVLLDVTIRALSSNIGAIALLTDWTAVWRREVNVFWWPVAASRSRAPSWDLRPFVGNRGCPLPLPETGSQDLPRGR